MSYTSSPFIRLDNRTATTAPVAGNDNTQGYSVQSRWTNVTTDTEYVCVDASTGAAVWEVSAPAGGGGGPTTAVPLTYDTSTVDGDPGGPGGIRFNNAVPTLATQVYLDNQDADGMGMAAITSYLQSGTHVIFWQADDSTKHLRVRVDQTENNGGLYATLYTASVVPSTGWTTPANGSTLYMTHHGPGIEMDYLSMQKNPALTGPLGTDTTYVSLWANNASPARLSLHDTNGSVNRRIVLQDGKDAQDAVYLTERGDHVNTFPAAGKGEIWSKSDTPNSLWFTNDLAEDVLLTAGSKGSLSYKWDTSTAATDPGSGDVKMDNAAAGTASNLYISTTDRHGLGVEAILLQQISPRSQIIIAHEQEPFRRARFWVSDWPTDNTGWITIPVDNTKDSQSTVWSNPAIGRTVSVIILPPAPGRNANKIQIANNETIATDATEIVIGGFYLDTPTANRLYSWEMLAKYTSGGGTGNQDIELRLYDMGADGSPTAGTLRSTLSVTSTSIDRVTQTLTVAASPGTGTNEIQDAARMYEVRAYLDAGGSVDSAIIYSATFVEV